MEEVELTTARLLRIYWSFLWRQILGGFVVGLIGGFIFGFIAGLFGFGGYGASAGTIGGVIAGFIWMAVVLRMILKKRYRGFRIALLAPSAEQASVFQ